MRIWILSVALAGLMGAAGCDKNGRGTEPEAPSEPGLGEEPIGEPAAPEQPLGGPDQPAQAGPDNLVIGDDPCEQDTDCRPAQCCHATGCVAAENAPDCSDVMCTEECRANTIDCGGECVCHEGKCAARLNDLGIGAPVQ